MAGFLELIDNTLGTHFDTPVYDPAKGRKKMVAEIDKAAQQHSEGRTKVPNRTWKVGNNNAVSYSPRLNGHPIRIADKETNFVPAERFGEFLTGFKAAVEQGDFDKQIKAALEGKGSASGSTTTRKRSSSTGDKPWAVRKGYDDLSVEDKRAISSRYRFGKNPDNSLIAEVGHKPDAPFDQSRKKA